jgi:hypothetical protein
MRYWGSPYSPAPSVHRAPLTGKMSWSVPSETHSDVTYTVTRTPDGQWQCDCLGCHYGARADGECKHIDRVRGWLADDPAAAEAAALAEAA